MNSKKLYHFLMNNECHLHKEKDRVIAWVVVYFDDLKEFTEIVNCIEGVEATIKIYHLSVVLNDIIENNEEELSDYKECFGDEWKEYFEE